jgi:hypothetical protein
MYKSLLSLAMSALLLGQAAAGPLYVPPQSEKEARRAEKVKARIEALGTGEKARVRVSVRGQGRRLVRGYVSQAGAENFTVVDPKTGVVTVIPYSQVKAVNPSGVAPLILTLGVSVGVIVTVVAVALAGLKKS